MPADILVVTPSQTLGESIRRTLEETALYRIHIVNNKASAIVRADEVGIPLAMLDLALGEEWVQEIGVALRTIQKGINLIILSEDNITPPAFDELRPWILVRKPFTMTDFMSAISKPQEPVPAARAEEEQISWLSDQTKAAQHLTRLTLSSSAQAALITRKAELWAYAGGLSREAAQELAQTVSRNWKGQKGADLLRFIRLETTKEEHMLYATSLTSDVLLAFVFESETPFSTIRAQAGKLVADLDEIKISKPIARQPVQEPTPPLEEPMSGADDIPSITNIITDVPAPTPSPLPAKPKRKPEKVQDIDPDQTLASEPLADASAFSREISPSHRLTAAPRREPASRPARLGNAESQPQPILSDVEVTAQSKPQPRPATPVKPDDMAVTRPSAPAEKRPATPVAIPNPNDATRESPTTEAARKLVVEPVSAGMYHLAYACLLVPRFSTHFLTGDLANRIDEWMPSICVSFGWRLEFLAVRPEYLQWVVNVQPNTSPGHLMRIIRQQTSAKIFEEFPRFKRENTSTDFWAPGYLIMGGSQPHPPQLVKDYINQTRERQGLQQEQPSQRK